MDYRYTDEALASGKTGFIPSDVDPEDLDDPGDNLVWESSNPSVVEVDRRTGMITAVSAGFARVSVTTQSGSELSVECDTLEFNVVVVPQSYAVGYTEDYQTQYTFTADPSEEQIIIQSNAASADQLNWRLFRGDSPDASKDITKDFADKMDISSSTGRVVLNRLPAGVYHLTAIPVKDDVAQKLCASYGEASGSLKAVNIQYMGVTIIIPPAGSSSDKITLEYQDDDIHDTYDILEGLRLTENEPLSVILTGNNNFYVINNDVFNYVTTGGALTVNTSGSLCTGTGKTLRGWQPGSSEDGICEESDISEIKVIPADLLQEGAVATTRIHAVGNIDYTDEELTTDTGIRSEMQFYDNEGNLYTAIIQIRQSDEALNLYKVSLIDILNKDGNSIFVSQVQNEEGRIEYKASEYSGFIFGDDNSYRYTPEICEDGKIDTWASSDLIFSACDGKFFTVNGEEDQLSIQFGVVSDSENSKFEMIDIDFSGLTMYADEGRSDISFVRGSRADGSGAGKPSGTMTIGTADTDGYVYGEYENGDRVLICHIIRPSAADPEALKKAEKSEPVQLDHTSFGNGLLINDAPRGTTKVNLEGELYTDDLDIRINNDAGTTFMVPFYDNIGNLYNIEMKLWLYDKSGEDIAWCMASINNVFDAKGESIFVDKHIDWDGNITYVSSCLTSFIFGAENDEYFVSVDEEGNVTVDGPYVSNGTYTAFRGYDLNFDTSTGRLLSISEADSGYEEEGEKILKFLVLADPSPFDMIEIDFSGLILKEGSKRSEVTGEMGGLDDIKTGSGNAIGRMTGISVDETGHDYYVSYDNGNTKFLCGTAGSVSDLTGISLNLTSSDNNVVTVDNINGIIEAKGPGVAIVAGTYTDLMHVTDIFGEYIKTMSDIWYYDNDLIMIEVEVTEKNTD